jgi:hypothetical protein
MTEIHGEFVPTSTFSEIFMRTYLGFDWAKPKEPDGKPLHLGLLIRPNVLFLRRVEKFSVEQAISQGSLKPSLSRRMISFSERR